MAKSTKKEKPLESVMGVAQVANAVLVDSILPPSLPIKRGQPSTYAPETLASIFDEYCDFVENSPIGKQVPSKRGVVSLQVRRPKSIVDFCQFAGLTRSSLYDYSKKPEYSDITTRVREAIEADQLTGAIAGIYDSSIISRVLHLADHQDVTTNGKDVQSSQAINVIVDKEAASIIQSVGKMNIG